jgi:hypothetical protein
VPLSFEPAKNISEGGVGMLCQITGDESPAFVLNTNRGSCISQDSGMSGQVTLTGTVTLNAPTTYSARIVTLASDLKLITLGWPLSIQAHTSLLKVLLRSFRLIHVIALAAFLDDPQLRSPSTQATSRVPV